MTVGMMMDRALLDYGPGATRRAYEQHAKTWREEFPRQRVERLRREDLEEWVGRALTRWAPATVALKLRVFKLAARKAQRSGLLVANPAELVDPPRIRNTQRRVLAPVEETRLRGELPPEHYELVEVALYTGLRRGEVFGLRRRDFDSREQVLTVTGKGKVTRTVPVDDATTALLLRRWEREGTSLLVPSPVLASRARDAGSWATYWLKPALERAGVHGVTFHALRRTYATRLLQTGANLRVVQELLGHSSIRITERYTHPSREDLVAAVRRLRE